MLTPQKFFNFWIVITLFLFCFGPLDYSCNKYLAVLYIGAFLIVANFFYYIGIHTKLHLPRSSRKIDLNWLLNVSIWYGFLITLVFFLESSVRYGFGSFSITQIITQMANTYTNQNSYIFLYSGWIISYTKWVRIIAIIMGAVSWNELSKLQKGLYISMCCIIVVHNTIFVGSQKEIIDLAIYIIVPVIMKWTRGNKILGMKKKIVIGCLFIGICLFLGSVINARHQLWTDLYNSSASTGADDTNWLVKLLPDSIENSVVYLLGYLTQGYRGLALCLTLPFEWAYGMGGSFKLMNDISRWFSIPLSSLEVSYPVRMEEIYHVGAYSNWHTIFPWIASDVTFIGAIIVVSVFIFFWAEAWREFMLYDSWISKVLFTHLSILVLYIPCNNQLFQTRDSIVATIAFFVLWYFYHGIQYVKERRLFNCESNISKDKNHY